MHIDDTVVSQKLSAVERRCPQCNVLVPDELERCPNDGTVLSISAETELDSRYDLIEPIGKGGMSVVYKARHKLMGNLVAVKLLQDKLTDNATYVKRFQIEAQALAVLDHPTLIKVHDFGVLPSGFTYLVMDYADGASLSDVLHATTGIPATRALPLFIQICDGLSHAHAKGILHRDLKPSNVIVVQDPQLGERAKIVDFGIAKMQGANEYDSKLTATGEVFGSPYYMSPEQCTGAAVDGRSDVYAMGVLMYETLAGKLPLSGSNVFETIHKQINEVPQPLAKLTLDPLAIALSPIIEKALKKDPTERYQSFDEMLSDLRALSEGRTVKVKTRLPAGKLLAAAIGAASLLLAGSIAACYFTHAGPFAPPVVQSLPKPAPPHTVTKPSTTESDDTDEDPEKKAKPDHTLSESNWLMGMSDQLEADQWHDFASRGVINLIGRNVGAEQIAKLAANKDAYMLNLQGNPTIDDTALLPLRGHPSIETLRLTGASITAKSIDGVFATMPKLKHLYIGHTKITPNDFPLLAHLKHLQDLWLDDSKLTDADFDKLPAFPKVSKLRLDDNSKLTDAATKIIASKFPNLKILCIRRIPITDASLPTLVGMPRLNFVRATASRISVPAVNALQLQKQFRVDWDPSIEAGTDYAAEKRAAWDKASHWHPLVRNGETTIRGAAAHDGELLAAARIPRIDTIWMIDTPHISDQAMIGLHSRKLEKLSRTGVDLDQNFFQSLLHIPGLTFLNLSWSNFDAKNLKYLEYCGSLTDLCITGNALKSKADLQYLPRQIYNINVSDIPWFDNSCVTFLSQHCPDLTWYHMTHTGITDGAIDELEKLPHLNKLIVSKSAFSQAGLRRLAEMKNRGVDVQIEDN